MGIGLKENFTSSLKHASKRYSFVSSPKHARDAIFSRSLVNRTGERARARTRTSRERDYDRIGVVEKLPRGQASGHIITKLSSNSAVYSGPCRDLIRAERVVPRFTQPGRVKRSPFIVDVPAEKSERTRSLARRPHEERNARVCFPGTLNSLISAMRAANIIDVTMFVYRGICKFADRARDRDRFLFLQNFHCAACFVYHNVS